MNSFNYEAVVNFGGRIRCLKPCATTEAISNIAAALDLNLKRLGVFAHLPVSSLTLGRQTQAIRDIAALEIAGQLGVSPEMCGTLEKRCGELTSGWHSYDRPTLDKMKACERSSFRDQINEMSQLADTKWYYGEQLSALYSAILLGAYTCFESLSSDLWVTAVNIRPKSLAANVLMQPIRSGSEEATDEADKRSKATIPLADLLDHDFDVSKCMGEILKQQRRVSFASLGSTKAAYLEAFRVPASKGRTQSSPDLDKLLSTTRDVKALESIRNLLAHQGGRVDEKFQVEARGYEPELRDAPINTMLALNGDMVAKYAGAAVTISISLLEFVDGWLQNHSE